jgi:serine/threonine-protein kinase
MAPELLTELTEETHENTTHEFRLAPVTSSGPALPDTAHEIAAHEMLSFAARYDAQHLLGKGGMGEVRLHRDARIGRDVAMKVIRADRDHQAAILRTRFLREARVQGQLEHPSIVPVYDVGFAKDGALYFTMKRVQGLTFADVLDRLRKKDPLATAEHTQRKLLAAFASVCLAVAFAHTRRVIHRDLKPSNVMLGRFGEVYVLDWGIAKILDEPEEPSSTSVDAEPLALAEDSQQVHVTTKAGAFVGTLGYVSPEQLHGEPIDARSDVYSLGAILFALLALEPLNAGSSVDVVRRTTEGVDARCSVRVPGRDIPPELEAICIKATRVEPEDRFASARALYDAVQRYLDGDRDTERRKELAHQHAQVAMTAIERARTELVDASTHRANALAELGRSLALDPANEQALAGIVSLLVDPPREMPPEVAAQMEASRTKAVRTIATTGGLTYTFCLLIFVGFWWLMGVKDWRTTALIGVFCTTSIVVCACSGGPPRRPTATASSR